MTKFVFIALVAALSANASAATKYDCVAAGGALSRLAFIKYTDTDLGGFQVYRSKAEKFGVPLDLAALLDKSANCQDMEDFLPGSKKQVYRCVGEMIIPNGVYGQVILSRGAFEWLLNSFLPFEAGYICREVK